MVETRSQKKNATAATAIQPIAAPSSERQKKRRDKKKTIYRGFVISGNQFQANVDRFYEQMDQQCAEKNVLTSFWLSTPNIVPPEIPIEFQQKLLIDLINNEPMWEKLEKTIQNCVVPHEAFLIQPDIQQQMRDGQVQFSYKLDSRRSKAHVDLTPLKEFAYWIRLIQKLFCSIQSSLLQKCEKLDSKLERALVARDIYRFSVSCSRLITNKYAFSGLRFFATQIRKLVEFFNEGLEFVLYAFGIFHPEMVTDEYYPYLSRDKLYGVAELAIDDEDSVFGEAKRMFRRFY
jgi:hypothetical protein